MTVRISQKSAILIERARQFGYSDGMLLSVVITGDIQKLSRAEDEDYQYNDFLSYAQEYGEDLITAVTSGYQIKFNTINGLKVWLADKVGVKPELDYQVGEGCLIGVPLTNGQLAIVQSSIATNWKIIDRETGYDIMLAALATEEMTSE